jgi:tripartite-type tricarboxylate transporter receptor subunit TctC
VTIHLKPLNPFFVAEISRLDLRGPTLGRPAFMNVARRHFLVLAGATAVAPALSWRAAAQNYPTRPVRLIVGFAAGGPTDLFARVLADLLSARWGTGSVIVENKPGAGTIIATTAVAKAPPDGYTILLASSQFLINPAIGQKLPYDALKDFAPISMIADSPLVLVAHKLFPANTVAELVQEAKKTGTPINFASPGPRGSGHLAGEMLQQRAGIKMQHINYNGSAPALTDVIGGRVPLMFDLWQSIKPHVEAGGLKLVATAGARRLPAAPQVPTIAETYPDFGASALSFVVGPARIPEPILQKLSADIRTAVDSPEFALKMHPLGVNPKGSSPQELRSIMHMEVDKWSVVAKAANIKDE